MTTMESLLTELVHDALDLIEAKQRLADYLVSLIPAMDAETRQQLEVSAETTRVIVGRCREVLDQS